MHGTALTAFLRKCFHPHRQLQSKAKAKDGKPPTRNGWLEKMSGGRGSKWDKRFFELNTSGSLLYYKKEGGKNVGSIYLRGCPVRLDPEDAAVILIQTGALQGTRAEAENLLFSGRC